MTQEHDPVDHPSHYTSHPSGIECIQVTERMSFCLGNAVKYIWRADLKDNAIEDLEKAAWYLQREISRRRAAVANEHNLYMAHARGVFGDALIDGMNEMTARTLEKMAEESESDLPKLRGLAAAEAIGGGFGARVAREMALENEPNSGAMLNAMQSTALACVASVQHISNQALRRVEASKGVGVILRDYILDNFYALDAQCAADARTAHIQD